MSEDRDVTAHPPRDDVAVLVRTDSDGSATQRRDVVVVIPAAGSGTRLGGGPPKALRELGGAPLLAHAVRGAVRAAAVGCIVVAAPPGQVGYVEEMLAPEIPSGLELFVVAGGAERPASVSLALAAAPAAYPIVLVHDAARPLTPCDVFDRVADAVRSGHPAVIPVLPVVDTIKRVDAAQAVVETVDRAALRAVQTPQGFSRELLLAAHAAAAGPDVTDDAGMVEAMGVPVWTVLGADSAFKITRPHDLLIAGLLLASTSPLETSQLETGQLETSQLETGQLEASQVSG